MQGAVNATQHIRDLCNTQKGVLRNLKSTIMVRSAMTKHKEAPKQTGVDKQGNAVKQRKVRRRKRVKSEINRLRKSTHLLNSRASFRREVRSVLSKMNPNMRITSSAMEALQEASEAAITEALMSANAIATRCAKRAGPLLKDMQTAVKIGHPHLMARK